MDIENLGFRFRIWGLIRLGLQGLGVWVWVFFRAYAVTPKPESVLASPWILSGSLPEYALRC